MIRKRIVDKPFNFGYTIMYNEYPKELHNAINAPGIFKEKRNTKVKFKDGTSGEMDSSYIIDPDFKVIFEQMIANGEHQSTPVDDNKIRMISYYGIQQIHDENLPQISYIASHIPKNKHVQTYQRSPSDIVKPYFLDLGEDDNKKRLSRVKSIVKKQTKFSNEDALNLGIITLFAPRNIACEVTEEVVEIYAKISDQLSPKMEFTLYSVLSAMIDAYFDYEKDYDRMMKIMNKNTTDETVEKIESIDIFKNKLQESYNQIEEFNSKLNESNSELKKSKSKLKKSNNELKKSNIELEKSKKTILILQKENQKLKNKLASK